MGELMPIKAHGGKGASLRGLLGHCQRDAMQQEMMKRGKSKAQYDPSMSYLNFDLAAPDGNTSAIGMMRLATLSQTMYVNPGPTTNVAASWVWTMPDDYFNSLMGFPPEEARKKTKEFFQAVKDFLDERYCGDGCVLSASVHLDEYSPHMHYIFVPRVANPKYGKNPDAPEYKVALSSLTTKKDMYSIHPDLEAYLCKRLGVAHVGIKKEDTEEQRRESRMSHDKFMQSKREAEKARMDFFQERKTDWEKRNEANQKILLGEAAALAATEKDAKEIAANIETVQKYAKDGVYVVKPGMFGKKVPGKVVTEPQYQYLIETASRAAGASYDANQARAKLDAAEARAEAAEKKADNADKAQQALTRLVEVLADKTDKKHLVARVLEMVKVKDPYADLQAEAERVAQMVAPKKQDGKKQRQERNRSLYLGR